MKAKRIIQHAIWTLKFGPCNEAECREPDAGDIAAIALLERLLGPSCAVAESRYSEGEIQSSARPCARQRESRAFPFESRRSASAHRLGFNERQKALK